MSKTLNRLNRIKMHEKKILIAVLILLSLISGCIESTQAPIACFDSDLGRNYYEAGNIEFSTTTDSQIVDGSESDFCATSEALVEQFCSGNSEASTIFRCPLGCEDGACIGCNSPVGDFDEYFCKDGIIRTCNRDFGFSSWSIDEFCPVNNDESSVCINDNEVKSSLNELCEKKPVGECEFNSDCNDGNSCTIDRCSSLKCSNAQIDCPSGTFCDSGVCESLGDCSSDVNCDDLDDETTDSCVDGECINKTEKGFLETFGFLIIIGIVLTAGIVFLFLRRKK